MPGHDVIAPILEFLFAIKGVDEQSGFNEEARQDILERRDTMRDESTGLRGRVLPSIAKLGREQISMLEGSGVQQKRDVRRRAATRLAGVQSNLQRRGLGNTTIGASMAKGFGEFEEDALARVDEQVRQERMQTHGYWGLLGQTMDVDLTGQRINIEAGGAIPAQQSNALAYSEVFGRFVPPPEAPEAPGTDIAGPLIGAGATLGSAAILSSAAPVVAKTAAMPFTGGLALAMCIDGDAVLEMLDETRMLKDIKIGDKVLNSLGEHVEVVWKDYGYPAESNEYVELSCGAQTLIATIDHCVGGKPAGEWEGAKKVGWVLCGDIRLADDSDYIANGFVVTSQLTRVSAGWAEAMEELCHN